MIGYKATDKDMKCRGFQFELGKWYECEGELVACENGFHFCEQPSGPWAYYTEEGTRVFKVECEGVLDRPFVPGADAKRVCRRIRLVEEISISGDGNTGDRNNGNSNTGNWNTGDSNTGYRNTGDGNTGNRNTGYRNTGDRNNGNSNTGNWNTGDRNNGDSNTGYSNTGDGNTGNRNNGNSNTGNWNTGDRNNGDSNTGYRNTGDRNNGDSNTGDGNATDYSSGFFCISEPKVVCFDEQTELTRNEFFAAFPQWDSLCYELLQIYEIDFAKYSMLPGITLEKLKALHKKHIDGRG